MDFKGKKEREFLDRYMNPGNIENAPEGFTGKLMQIIDAEAPPVKKGYILSGAFRIPAIAASIAICLVVFSLLSNQKESTIFIAIGEKLKSFTDYLPKLDKISLPELALPGIFVYICVGLLVLWLLDLSLENIFNRSRN